MSNLNEPIRTLEDAGHHLSTIRNDRGISQQELSERANIPQPRISDIEHGEHNPTLSTFLKLLSGLDYDLNLNERQPESTRESDVSIGGMTF